MIGGTAGNWRRGRLLNGLVILVAGATLAHGESAGTLDRIMSEGSERIAEGQAAQAEVAKIHGKSVDLVTAYEERLRVVEGLESYSRLLALQLDNQQREVESIQRSIADAAVIERQIIPLLLRMLEGLEDFIQLDVPFLLEERLQRVANLRSLLERADITATEKARRVFEAYQIESDFGSTIEAYRAKVEMGGDSVDAEFLRIGRIALLYRTLNGDAIGRWDQGDRTWKPLEGRTYARHLDKGLQIARQEIAPELLTIPVQAPTEAGS
jgi:hypothetical protein